MLKAVEKQNAREASGGSFCRWMRSREGARRMLIEALEAEADDCVGRHRGKRDEHGRALVVRNGLAQGRKLTLGTGTLELKAPELMTGAAMNQEVAGASPADSSHPYMGRSPKAAEVLSILYLRGISTGDSHPAPEGLLGEDAAGLSPTNIARLTAR